ncbi:hypothetical protein BJ322DRAFT_1114760 [Thelephora terrestris]|nr:hypothetical protein BJ322DRAFT_1114760 [Thelephora terrestris]
MQSSGLVESIFSRVKISPEFIPLLVYLHPPPTYSLTASQADYWTQSLVDYYPEASKHDVLKALAVDPARTVSLIPYILSKISGPRIVSESQINARPARPAADLSVHEEISDGGDPSVENRQPPRFTRFCEPRFISDGPSTVEGNPDPIPSSLEGERFHFLPQPEGWNILLREISVHEQSLENSDLSSDASDAGSLDVPLDAFTPPQLVQIYLQGLRAEMEEIQNLVVFRVDHNTYHLSVAKVLFFHAAYGFVLGAFSFLWLRTLSYSPLAALIGGLPLGLALALVVGVPISN